MRLYVRKEESMLKIIGKVFLDFLPMDSKTFYAIQTLLRDTQSSWNASCIISNVSTCVLPKRTQNFIASRSTHKSTTGI
jgi:hypothetical protein